ncbi:unnamed protein product, partial [Prorocentrum cordatum]
RLDDINAFFKSSLLGDTEMDRQVRAQYVKERDELQARLEAAKHLEKNANALSNKLQDARRNQAACQAKRESAELAVQKAQQALEQAREDETEPATAILELETRLRGALGGGEKFAADLATMAACVGRFKGEAAAAQAQAAPREQGPEAAPGGMPGAPGPDMEVGESAAGDVDDLDAETRRQHLKSCGVEVPVPAEGGDDPAPLRGQLKRQLNSFYTVHKKLKK